MEEVHGPPAGTKGVRDLQEAIRLFRSREQLYETAFRNSPIIFACTNRDFRYEWIFNPHADFDPVGVIGKRDDELDAGPGIAALVQLKRSVFGSGRQERREIVFDRSDGPRTYDITATPLLDESGHVHCVLTTALDISQRKQAEEALREMNESLDDHVRARTRQVQELASQLTLAEQEERRRLAHLLHDDLQQQLYGVQIQMGTMGKLIEAGKLEAVLQLIARMKGWIDQSIELTRTLAVQLMPPELEGADLAAALRALLRKMSDLYDLTVDLRTSAPVTGADAAMRVLLYQIVRELLFNIVKHAGTDQATVELRAQNGDIEISISDEGRGFDANRIGLISEQEDGFGLPTVRRRLEMLGGRMEITSAPDRGTRVTIIAPLSAAWA